VVLAEVQLGPLLIIVFYVSLLGGLAFYQASRNRRRIPDRLLGPLELRWNGRTVPGDSEFEPLVEISSQGIPGVVTVSGFLEWPRHTRVHFQWSSWRRLRVAPRNVGRWARRIVGGSEVEVGDPAFDRAFLIETSDDRWAKALLDFETRRALWNLRNSGGWFGRADVMLDLGSAGVSLRLGRGLSRDANALESVVALAAAILGRARASAAPDVELSPAEARSGSECPVCGHRVEGDGRNCPKCGTPHHADCWKYSGGCAIYGCEARARKPVT